MCASELESDPSRPHLYAGTLKDPARVAELLREAPKVTVYYDPDCPRTAALTVGSTVRHALLATVLGAALIWLTLALISEMSPR